MLILGSSLERTSVEEGLSHYRAGGCRFWDDDRNPSEDRMTTVNDPQRVWILDYSLSIYQAEIDWIKWLEAQIGAA